MKFPGKTSIPTADLRRVALAALVSALDGDEPDPKDKSGRSGIRMFAAGALTYAAGAAAFKNRNLIREQLLASQRADDEDTDEDEFVDEDEARGEPDGEEDFEESERDYDDEPEEAESAPPRRKRPSRLRS